MSAGSSGSNDSDRDIDPYLNSVKVANFILLYGLRTVEQLFHSLLVSSVSVGFFRCWLHTFVCASCLCRSLPFILVNTVGMLMAWASLLSWSVCVVSSVEGLISSVCVWTQVLLSPTDLFFCLPLVHALGLFSPGGRWEVLLILGPAGNFSCFFNGLSSLDPHQLDRYSAGINLQAPS